MAYNQQIYVVYRNADIVNMWLMPQQSKSLKSLIEANSSGSVEKVMLLKVAVKDSDSYSVKLLK